MKKLTSEILSLIYIEDLRIKTGENELTDEQFAKLSARKEYKALVKKGRFIEGKVTEDVEDDAPVEPKDMKVVELRAYGKTQGLEGISQMNKTDILAMLSELED
jgi:hypothetical protein